MAQRWFDELFNQHNVDVIDELVAPDARHHQSFPNDFASRDETKAVFAAILAAMPDLSVTVDDILSDGNLVVARWTVAATFQNDLAGVPATGDVQTFTGINIFAFSCGIISQSWSEIDRLAQFGLATPAIPAASPETDSTAASCPPASEEDNAAIAQAWLDAWNAHDVTAIDDLASAYYLSIDTVDRPGVLAAVASVFGAHDVSIASMEQEGRGDAARIVFVTHRAREADVQATVAELRGLDAVRRVNNLIRVLGAESEG